MAEAKDCAVNLTVHFVEAEGPLTLFAKLYNLDRPRDRAEYEMDTNARKWAEAVFRMWERFGDERDEAESVDSGVERGRAEGLHRAIQILNEELELRGLDLEASCG